jgi:hypothetical protein
MALKDEILCLKTDKISQRERNLISILAERRRVVNDFVEENFGYFPAGDWYEDYLTQTCKYEDELKNLNKTLYTAYSNLLEKHW